MQKLRKRNRRRLLVPLLRSKPASQPTNIQSKSERLGDQVNYTQPAPRTNIFAVVGLILAFFSSTLGLIFSVIGLVKVNEYGSGKGIAIAGIIISIASMILSLIAALVLVPIILSSVYAAGMVL